MFYIKFECNKSVCLITITLYFQWITLHKSVKNVLRARFFECNQGGVMGAMNDLSPFEISRLSYGRSPYPPILLLEELDEIPGCAQHCARRRLAQRRNQHGRNCARRREGDDTLRHLKACILYHLVN